jgi:hypothetical protein
MLDETAYILLKTLQRHKGETVPIWYETYRSCFSKAHVPIVGEHFDEAKSFGPVMVHVNKEVAMTYLKEKYNFYSKEELAKKLEAIAHGKDN